MNVASPCINICRMNGETGLCEGCFRTLDEIAGWSRQGDDERSRILALVAQRRSARVTPLGAVAPPLSSTEEA
ncbi:MAG TPA: DUF1289 domain-containing protein [Aromatoleum sp.]|uniref:DUF1289 domain-containing protein n=1 Tax=Aromatoleum sp. TaxID=2307007 RepID=UPI002B48E4A8|nr:DUF1289 domain-containing protein [Aromatoleum sp.]HJV26512.1 DUF1289 domain-containing protein [Aromatoleum sp.]